MIKEIERVNEVFVIRLEECSHLVLRYEVVGEVLIDCPCD